ncbi:mechanosensitive ion channel domain-containing protein [Desulfococcus sp.]|uniref:mechanosensitive ion channel domain-containing protein n=1 Tax=Desulfococcus sp. TaxID=2025834 RepID=UPI003593868D
MRRILTFTWLAGLFRVVLFLLAVSGAAHADPDETSSPALSSPSDASKDIRNLVEASLTTQSDDIKDLKAKLSSLEEYEKAINATLSAISIQQTAHTTLLLASESDLQQIIQAKTDNDAAIANLSGLMDKLRIDMSSTGTRLAQAEELILMNQKDLSTVQEGMPETPLTAKLIRKIRTLDDLLTTKKNLLQKMAGIHETAFKNLKESHDRLTAMKAQFDEKISQKKKEVLFIRKIPSMEAFDVTVLKGLVADVPARIVSNLKNDYQEILKEGYLRITGVTLFVVMVLIAMFRFKQKIYRWDKQQDLVKHYPRRHMATRMAIRSLPLGWTAAVLYFFAFVQNFYARISLSGIGFVVAFVWLLTRWGLDITRLWNQAVDHPIPEPLAVRLRWLMRMVRGITILAAFLIWIYGRTSTISAAMDIVFHLMLAAWAVAFNRRFKTVLTEKALSPLPLAAISKLLILVIYLIPLGGIVINLSGYRVLSGYWITSWGISSAIALWSWLTFNLIREWHGQFRKTGASAATETEKNRPLKWFFIQTCYLAWFWISLIGIIFAWYFDKTRFFVGIGEMMTLSLSVGNMNFSLFNVIEVAIVLLMTHVLTRIWPNIFQEKFMGDSGMDAGLKSSITVITIYVIWFLGFLMVLNILGFDSQSMAVALGGLGIGLGFGLQAIFNNFLSGIILLFERPIQVGDIIEVGGVLGEVKKINVRATLIQTYDNASLLIPNSEFISGQVTNWSFKDFRVRRSINIGVAYGSDVERVREILLEIADAIQDVYKYPKPVVLFTDFADSALLFQLRVWTHVDKGIAVETTIRFAIDREFRANQIEIPFPQQDVHIRSINPGVFKPICKNDVADETQ